MPVVKMNRTIKGAEDGIRVKLYEKGQRYNLKKSGFLYDPWIKNGTCVDFVEVKEPELKDIPSQVNDHESNPEPEKAAFENVTEKQTAKINQEINVELTKDQIKAALDGMGVKYDARLGVEKLEELLKEHTKGGAE